MAEELNEQLNNLKNEPRNNFEAEPLLKAEEKIKSLAFNEQPARESFRQDLKNRLLAARQKNSMKFWQVKFMAPALAFALVLAIGLSAYKLGFLPSEIRLAKLFPEKNSEPAANILPSSDLSKAAKITENVRPEIAGGKKLFGFTLIKPVFAEFEKISAAAAASLSGAKVALSELGNLADFEKTSFGWNSTPQSFTVEQKNSLAADNFFLANDYLVSDQQNGLDDFTDTYNAIGGSLDPAGRAPENSVFVTSDFALHLYHILIDRSFQKIEEEKLQPRLKEMTRALFSDALAGYRSASEPKLKEAYKNLAVYYLAPLAILDAGADQPAKQLNPGDFETFARFEEAQAAQNKALSAGKPDILAALDKLIKENLNQADDSWISNTARAELVLIDKAERPAPSPLFTPQRPDFLNDYTQFTPRSHYTKNKILKTYFMAMIWYGRMGFVLKSGDQTREALLITGQVNSLKVGDKNLSDSWGEFMSLIDFFVGATDDLTPFQYTEEMKKVFGDQATDKQLASDEMIEYFSSAAVRDLPAPKILSEVIVRPDMSETSKEDLLRSTMQFRFMGQRFTPDAYVLGKLTQGDEAPDPETGQKLPHLPTALMPISVLNSANTMIKGYLDSWVKNSAPDSDKVIKKVYNSLAGEFSALPESRWNENIYWSWLGAYRSLLGKYGAGYPFFMQGEPWQKKNLGTTLGSYAELKHDTLLYAKQAYAELGAGGWGDKIPPAPKGYVEPDPVFWARILALARATKSGLASRDFLPESFAGKYDNFISAAEFFQGLAEKELQNQKISDEDFEKLRTISRASLEFIVQPADGGDLELKDRRAGIIADIFTDAKGGQILYEATGKPNLIFVAVKDINGARLVAGAVYNHYEFAAPLEKRLTDEDWQAKVYDGAGPLPAEDAWTKEIKK
jgi:hypothetical protein